MAAAVRIRGGKVLGVGCDEDCIWGFYEVCGGADRLFGRLGCYRFDVRRAAKKAVL